MYKFWEGEWVRKIKYDVRDNNEKLRPRLNTPVKILKIYDDYCLLEITEPGKGWEPDRNVCPETGWYCSLDTLKPLYSLEDLRRDCERD